MRNIAAVVTSQQGATQDPEAAGDLLWQWKTVWYVCVVAFNFQEWRAHWS
jgi:hypothetical protein